MTAFVDPYFDAEHGCLRNRLGITDPDELGAREHAIVAVRQRQLDQQPGAPAATVDAWWAVHPFREGNGRTQRVIVGQLAANHDHPIAWRAFSPIQNIELSIAASDDPQASARPIRIAMDIAADYGVSTASDPATGLGIDRRFDLGR